jgi:hypothetical protein
MLVLLLAPAGRSNCKLATAGCCDGMGHRLEAAFSCIAVAHELGMTYVHQPFVFRGHKNSGRSYQQLDVIGAGHAQWNASMHAVRVPTLFHPARHGWFERLGASGCADDSASTVYEADNCWERFWPYVVERDRASGWFAVQAGIAAAARFDRAGVRHRSPWPAEAIAVAVHVRRADTAWQQLPNAYYIAVMAAMRTRHAVSGAAHRPLRFEVHHNDVTNETRDAFVGVSDTHVLSPKTSALEALQRMAAADVVVLSHSGMSVSAALLSNATAIYPCCDVQRVPLPHWHVAPCSGAVDLSAICWPPVGGANRGPARCLEGLRAPADCPRRTATIEMWWTTAKRAYFPWTEPLWRQLGLARTCHQGCEHHVRRQYHIVLAVVACVATLLVLALAACFLLFRA